MATKGAAAAAAEGEAEKLPEEKKTTRRKKASVSEESAAAPSKTLDEIFSELDQLMESLESEESLEKSFAMYQKGVALLKSANESIDRIEKQVKVLDDDEFLD